MNYALVAKLISIILGAITVAFGMSLGIAYMLDHPILHTHAKTGFSLSIAITASCSIAFFILGKTGTNTMFRKEALAVVGLGWIVASVFGALPYYLILPDISFISAIFESASGFTTTGASVLSDLEDLPKSLLFWRAITQWIGGLGVVVFFVAVLSFLGAGAKVLFSRESSANSAELDTARIQQGVFRLLYLYLGLSVACTLALRFCGLDWFEAVTHMFTTLSTGGFSTRSGSIADFHSPALEWTIIFFMAIGGTSFIPLIRLSRGEWKALSRSTEIKAYYAILCAATIAIALFLAVNPFEHGFLNILRKSAFQVTSIMTTTGFATDDFNQWIPVTHIILALLMIIGGCSGSTAGGAKVIRVMVATRICSLHLEKSYRAHVVRPIRVNQENVDQASQENVLVFLILMAFTAFIGLTAIAFLEPSMSFEGSVSAMMACLFNVGPGFAEVGPLNNFAPFLDSTKIILALLMILGRVELFAILALFAPSLWKRF